MKKIVLVAFLCQGASLTFAQSKKSKESISSIEKKCDDIESSLENGPKGGGDYRRITVQGGEGSTIAKIMTYYNDAEGSSDSTIFYFGQDAYNDRKNYGKLIKYI